jgi:ribosomal-protein-alanine N-acetyltransferase
MTDVTETSRVRLRVFTPEDLLALIEGAPQCEARMGVRLAAGLRDFFVSGDVSPAWLERLRSAAAADPWLHGFAVVEGEGGPVVGTAAFKGPPDAEGVVEIAYAIVPEYQGRGYATKAAEALVAFAFSDPRVSVLRAHTLPTPNASTRVLTKCLFTRVGEVVDSEDGVIWRWQRSRDAAYQHAVALDGRSPSENLRLARERAGLEPEQVANATGLNKPWIYCLESHDDEVVGNISIRVLAVLAGTVGTTPLALIDGSLAATVVHRRSPEALAALIERRIELEGLTAEHWGERIGWDISPFLADPQHLWEYPLDMLQALCSDLGVDWRETLAEAPGSSLRTDRTP